MPIRGAEMNIADIINEDHRIIPLSDVRNAQKIAVFGAGSLGERAVGWLNAKSIYPQFIVDNDKNKQGQELAGLPILSPEQLKQVYNEELLVVIASSWARDIAWQLREHGCYNYIDLNRFLGFEKHFDQELMESNTDQWIKVSRKLQDAKSKEILEGIIKYRWTCDPIFSKESDFPQYLHPVVKPMPGDCIIDAGAWRGDTASLFTEETKGKCKIYALEPEVDNYQILQEVVNEKGLRDVVIPRNCGASDKNQRVYFDVNKLSSGAYEVAAYDTGVYIEVMSIDDIATQENIVPSLIKMDIEGSEYDALCGAAHTIAVHKPKLQICVYHKWDDIWRLMDKIIELNPEYQFYLGHHIGGITETVLYAI